jgi:DNA-binding MarR family transcriptional regulator
MYALASYMMRATTVGIFQAIGELDLSFTQIKALCALDSEGDESSVKALAQGLGVSVPAMSRAVDGLFERGLVEREEHSEDRRMKRVRLTERGRAVPRALSDGRLSAMSELIESLDDDEAATLARALAPIVERRTEIAGQRPDVRERER